MASFAATLRTKGFSIKCLQESRTEGSVLDGGESTVTCAITAAANASMHVRDSSQARLSFHAEVPRYELPSEIAFTPERNH